MTDDKTSLRDKIVGLSESSGRKSYYPMLQQNIRELQKEIAERMRAENRLRETLERIARQQAAIAEISTHPDVFHGRLAKAAPMMAVKTARAMRVARASLWIMHDDRLCCMDKYDAASDTHSSGQCLECSKYSEYFDAISKGSVIAENVLDDLRTCRFSTKYLELHGISAMLDMPVFIEGRLEAVICFEHAGAPRAWQPDEVTFAGRLADQVALILGNQRRRLAEERLREAHMELTRNLRFTEALLDAIPIPLFYKDSELRYLGCNRTYTDVMGITTQEIHGKTARDLWPDLAPEYEHQDLQLIRDKSGYTCETIVRDKNGDTREVIIAKQLFLDERDHTDGIIGSFVDITERNRSERESQRLRTLLSNIINSMPSILIGVDAEGRIAQWNQRAELVTGVPESQAQGRFLDEVVVWLAPEMPRIRQSIAGRMPLFEGKIRRIEGGESIFEDVTIYPLISDGVEGAVIRIDDVTDKVRIEEVLVQSEKMLSVGGLAAGMAHEINNPLASIMGNAQVMETRLLHDLPQNTAAALEAGITREALHDYLERRGIPRMLQSIRESGGQAAQIVSNMLSFSRKGGSAQSPEDVTDILERTLELASTDYNLKKNYDFKKIRVIREFQPDVPKALANSIKLQQVFLNLLRNGAEAMSEKTYPEGDGPAFTLRVRRNLPWVRIELEDNGPGLSEAIRKRIFEPFFTTKPVDKGTGLGLSVSYFIITEEHCGMMSVESSPGHWTRFVMDLPVATRT
jgi:PAS domain S-box-containing protein